MSNRGAAQRVEVDSARLFDHESRIEETQTQNCLEISSFEYSRAIQTQPRQADQRSERSDTPVGSEMDEGDNTQDVMNSRTSISLTLKNVTSPSQSFQAMRFPPPIIHSKSPKIGASSKFSQPVAPKTMFQQSQRSLIPRSVSQNSFNKDLSSDVSPSRKSRLANFSQIVGIPRAQKALNTSHSSLKVQHKLQSMTKPDQSKHQGQALNVSKTQTSASTRFKTTTQPSYVPVVSVKLSERRQMQSDRGASDDVCFDESNLVEDEIDECGGVNETQPFAQAEESEGGDQGVGEESANPLFTQKNDSAHESKVEDARHPLANTISEEDDSQLSSEHKDQCMSLMPIAVKEKEDFIAEEEDLCIGGQSPSETVSKSEERPKLGLANTVVKASLEHLRIRSIESSEDESSEESLRIEEHKTPIHNEGTGTLPTGSLFEQNNCDQIPAFLNLESDRSPGEGKAHSRHVSKDFRLTEINNQDLEFSRTLIEQVNEHNRSLLLVVDAGAVEVQSKNPSLLRRTEMIQGAEAGEMEATDPQQFQIQPMATDQSPDKLEEEKVSDLCISEVPLCVETANNDTKSNTETQALQDAKKILFEKVDKREVQKLAQKQKSVMELLMAPSPAYNNFEQAKSLMKFGIVGVKHNFKNNKSRKVVIQLSNDCSQILYQDMKEPGAGKKMFTSSTSLKLNKFRDLIYGGSTDNFRKHRRVMRTQIGQVQNPNDAESNLSQSIYSNEVCCPWQCVSLQRKDGRTLDFTISDDTSLLSFIHIFFLMIRKPAPTYNFLQHFKMQKVRLKLLWEARQSQLHLSHMFQLAIFKTLLERQRIATAELQASLKRDKQAFHSLFYRSIDRQTNSLREPTAEEQLDRLAKLVQHHTQMIASGHSLSQGQQVSDPLHHSRTFGSPSPTHENSIGRSGTLQVRPKRTPRKQNSMHHSRSSIGSQGSLGAQGTSLDRSIQRKKSQVGRGASFQAALQDYCRFRWQAYQFIKNRIKEPLANYNLVALDDY